MKRKHVRGKVNKAILKDTTPNNFE